MGALFCLFGGFVFVIGFGAGLVVVAFEIRKKVYSIISYKDFSNQKP